MEIYINGEELDFQLEDEKNLKEVMESVIDWAFKEGKVVDQIVINETPFLEDFDKLKNFPIESVKTLKITVIDIFVLVKNSLSEIQRYLAEVVEIIEQKDNFNIDELTKIVSGINWIVKIINKCDKLYNYTKHFTSDTFNYKRDLKNLEKNSKILEKFIKNNQTERGIEFLKSDISSSLNLWISNIDKLNDFTVSASSGITASREKVANQIYNIIVKIPDMQELIKSTVVDLQSGEEKESMKNIEIIAGTIESIISLLQVIKTTFSLDYNKIFYEEKSIAEFNKEIKDTLSEIVEAFENKDNVLIADLLEYEFLPRLERYVEILKLIAKEVNLEVN